MPLGWLGYTAIMSYLITVVVHEVRSLDGVDSDGMSDPRVRVRVGPRSTPL